MKSEQAMWMVLALVVLTAGCHYRGPKKPQAVQAPYGERQVWAVVPLRNESGSQYADGIKTADRLAQRLETVGGLDVLPVNRVLAAMQALELASLDSPSDVSNLRTVLGVDAVLVGSITAYDPYDPPKLGLAVELYFDPRRSSAQTTDVRKLVRAPTDDLAQPAEPIRPGPPVSVVSGFYDASDPDVHERLVAYAQQRGALDKLHEKHGWRLYQIDMDLYTEFVIDSVSRQLLLVEAQRLASHRLTEQPAP
ncbi:MAG: hypothetical protein Kow00105_11240 [Phycisphaeraceae bacterium]